MPASEKVVPPDCGALSFAPGNGAAPDPTNTLVTIDDPANGISIRMTLPPDVAQPRVVTAVGSPALCFGQSAVLSWSPAEDLAMSTTPPGVSFLFVPCTGEGCEPVSFTAVGSIEGSDITFDVPTSMGAFMGVLSVSVPGAARSGNLADCEGATSCRYDLSNVKNLGVVWEACGSGSG